MSALGDVSNRTSRLGRYELITRIGQGGMAEVQLALQHGPAGFEKLVVVKLVHENLAAQKDFVDMLLDEARVAALLKHPNVVDIYDRGQADGRYFIAMEYLEGEPLLAVLRAGREGKRLDILSTARLVADTAEALDAAHELRTMGGAGCRSRPRRPPSARGSRWSPSPARGSCTCTSAPTTRVSPPRP